MNRGPDGERLGPDRSRNEANGGIFCWEFCWEFLLGIPHEMLVICKEIIYQNMPEKNQSDLEGNYVSEIFLSYNGSAVFFEGMVPVGSLELLLKKNI